MTILKIHNPFNAPVYHEQTVESTMIVSRKLTQDGQPHGTVITSDFQEKGRGRVQGRLWQMESKINLPFTLILRFQKIEDIPAALSLRAGLAVSTAIEEFIPSLKNKVMIKWPNDIIIGSKKIAGILCEADGGTVHIGIGVNVAQKKFPASIAEKAGSLSLAAGIDIEDKQRFSLLEKILSQAYLEFETQHGNDCSKRRHWKPRIEERLYKKGQNVTFMEGIASCGKKISGCLTGISENGELLITPDGETEARPFITGELVLIN